MVKVEDVTAEEARAKLHRRNVAKLVKEVFGNSVILADFSTTFSVRDSSNSLIAMIYYNAHSMNLYNSEYFEDARKFGEQYELMLSTSRHPSGRKEFVIKTDYSH